MSVCLNTHLLPSLQFFLFWWEQHSGGCQQSQARLQEDHLFKREACWLGFHVLKDVFLSGSLFQRNSVVVSWAVANPYFFFGFSLLWIVLHSNTHLPESSDLLLSIVRTLHCFFFLCPWLQQRHRRALQVVLHEKNNASHDFSPPNIGPPRFESGKVSRFTCFWTVSWMYRDSNGLSCSDCWSWR